MTQNDSTVTKATSANESMICVPWVIFASTQGLRGEYKTTASASISATLEEEVSALCREFHNALGIQEVPVGTPVFLFWKARQSSHFILTQVLRASAPPGQRIAYEYFSFALTQADLHTLEGNPLRALEQSSIEAVRQNYAAGVDDPVCVTLSQSTQAAPSLSSPFQNGTWPASQENCRMLLTSIQSGTILSGTVAQTFATWWPNAQLPRAGVFDIVLRSDEARVMQPQEILSTATELNRSLSRSLLAPPSYDNVGTRYYRTLLHSAVDVQTMLNEAYFPAALEESPHRWMTRPQKVAGLCQKIADDLPDYATSLPAHLSDEIANQCAEWAGRYEDLARELQKLRHPNVLHQNQNASVPGAAKKPASAAPLESQRPVTRPNAQRPNAQRPNAQPSNAQRDLNPWAEGQTLRLNADAFYAQIGGTKSGHALQSTASKFGSILALLLISSVAAVGVFMADEEKPLPPSGNFSTQTASAPATQPTLHDAQHAYDLAYQLAKQRVKTASGLTRPQRLKAAREALAQVMGGNVAQLNAAEILKLAKRAPENVKRAAFRGMQNGEAVGISAQSQS